MIYKLKFDDGRIDWCTAKDMFHLLKSYDADYEISLQELESIEEISDEEAKSIMLKNTDYDEDDPEDMPEISLFDSAVDDEFMIVGSTEWV